MILLSGVNAVIALAVACALTRRYGWKPALGLPLTAIITVALAGRARGPA